MSKEMNFFIYLLEYYAEYKNKNAGDVLSLWDEVGITDFIYNMYEMYHIESIQNAFDDIDRILEKCA
ncbi:MAG: DUF3791 domain-containing protein [Clostridia bacterium]|nr:DUF3791 domain-containing protein [Clostridia bacterium]